jgi:hypothetical protein
LIANIHWLDYIQNSNPRARSEFIWKLRASVQDSKDLPE